MTYELAKQIKDAGFPQGGGSYIEEDGAEVWLDEESFDYDSYCFEPTLEELIEACSKELISENLNTRITGFDRDSKKDTEHLFEIGWSGEAWYADYSFYDSVAMDINGKVLEGWGKTPEVAVAKLWLALNKKE